MRLHPRVYSSWADGLLEMKVELFTDLCFFSAPRGSSIKRSVRIIPHKINSPATNAFHVIDGYRFRELIIAAIERQPDI